MSDTAPSTQSAVNADIIDELRTWLEENWDPDLTVGDWWERLGLAGWAAPTLPTNAYGRGVSRNDAVRIGQTISEFGALGAPGGLGLLLAAPTIAEHGTQEQIDLYVREIVTGKKAWCQLFSEPGAGSDLAGLTTRAVRDGDEWIVNGQKVWTSGGQIADLGMLVARTNPDVPKHQGITYFACDMHQDGVEIRPLREMTGAAMFNEVFLTDARVPDAARIGDENTGWAVANTTLSHERAGLGAGGGGGGGGSASPGTVANQLGRPAGEFVRGAVEMRRAFAGGGGGGRGGGSAGRLGGQTRIFADFAKQSGINTDATIRQDLVQLHILNELARYSNLRQKASKAVGKDIPGLANIAKLSQSNIMRLSRDIGLRILGPYGTLHAYTNDQRDSLNKATGNPFLGMITGQALYAQAPPIYGGTDQIQRNIIGERILGLPKEPNNDRVVPFKDLPKNG